MTVISVYLGRLFLGLPALDFSSFPLIKAAFLWGGWGWGVAASFMEIRSFITAKHTNFLSGSVLMKVLQVSCSDSSSAPLGRE